MVIIRQVILEYLADPRFELADLGWTEYRFPVVVMEEVVELGKPVALQLFYNILANAINLSKDPHVISRCSHR